MTEPVVINVGDPLLEEQYDAYEKLTTGGASYTPSWTSFGTQPAIGNGSLTGQYVEAGDFVTFSIALAPGSSTTYGTGGYAFSTPTAVAVSTCGVAFLNDDSTGFRYAGSVWIVAGAAAQAVVVIQFTNGTAGFSATSPVTLATSDLVFVAGVYKAT